MQMCCLTTDGRYVKQYWPTLTFFLKSVETEWNILIQSHIHLYICKQIWYYVTCSMLKTKVIVLHNILVFIHVVIEHIKTVSIYLYNILFYKLFILNEQDEFLCIWKLIIYQLIKIITRKSNNGNHPLRSCCACQNRDILYFIISFFSKWRATGINEF